MKAIFVIVTGLVWSTLVMYAIFWIESATGFNVFGLSVLIIIPIGAIIVGAACAAGIFGAMWVSHMMPNLFVFLFVVMVAIYSNALFYWFSYERDIAEAGLLHSNVSFTEYLNIYFESLALDLKGNSLELGTAGKWFAAIDVVGFVVGASGFYLGFLSVPKCVDCKTYLRHVATGFSYYDELDELAFYYDLVPLGLAEPDTLKLIANSGSHEADPKVKPFAWSKKVFRCPKCSTLYWRDKVSVWKDKEYEDIPSLTRLGMFDHDEISVNLFRNNDADRAEKSRAYYIGHQNLTALNDPQAEE